MSPAGPLARAGIAALLGAAALAGLGAILASTAGLLFVSGVTGAGVGLVLARASVPTGERSPALSRRAVTWLSIAVSIGAVGIADVATWVFARLEGGTLGLVEYLLATFGPFVPGELLVAGLAAAWGAGAGPVARS